MSIRDRKEIEEEIAKLQKELAEVNDLAIDMAKGDPKAIAIYLHDRMCKSDHSDRCGWYYEVHGGIHNWDDSSHKSWLERANRFIEKWGGDDILTKLEMALSL